eukprot:TRINITY_DN3082_c0_g1_i1.p1 TRINITY_DN3082_c0_g1~~TRINITY_DN3082_c0_g1_i1.p1  ORF type:complete len:319 (+),score=96.35 TRINITY_DN3082_c0_g1_i1:958-1914(+)
MKAGVARHAELESEILGEEVVDVVAETREEMWCLRLLDSVSRLRQLRVGGMTWELYIMGVVEGTWMVGIIDELTMVGRNHETDLVELLPRAASIQQRIASPEGEAKRAMLVDTKTRVKPTAPSEAQKRNLRLQLMCYKVLLDTLIAGKLPVAEFGAHFGLGMDVVFSDKFLCQLESLEMGQEMQWLTLEDVFQTLLEEAALLKETHDHLLLRYEWQSDRSLLGCDAFPFESEWVRQQLGWHLQYWNGQRRPEAVGSDEKWKCRFCTFSTICPAIQQQQLSQQQMLFQKQQEQQQQHNQQEQQEEQQQLQQQIQQQQPH